MARTYYVKKAQKPQGNCERCGKELKIGDPYKWVKPRTHRGASGWKRKRCMECPGWRPSELSSSKMASVMAAQESFEDGKPYGTTEDLSSAMESVAEAARDVAGEYTESADNQEEYFPGSSVAEESRDKAEQLESWADDIDSAAGDLSDAEEEGDCAQCQTSKDDGPHHEFTAPEGAEEQDEDDPAPVLCGEENCDAEEEDHHDFEVDMDALADEHAEIVHESPV